MGLSNAAVMRLNYPTHMMFKSCKLIPVMIGSMLILGIDDYQRSPVL
jgi:adenosine 3'-phospho 5'-phosphosulfate transporter B3